MAESELTGRRVIVTGATSGIGLQLSRVFASRGAEVGLAVRNVERGRAVAAELGPRAEVLAADFASMKSVRALAKTLIERRQPIDVLMLNAGVFGQPFKRTDEGFEYTFASNYLGHFLLVHLLLEAKAFAPKARIVATLTSAVHANPFAKADLQMLVQPTEAKFSKAQASPSSKVLLVMMVQELARRAGDSLVVVGVNPGAVQTGNVEQTPALLRPLVKLLSKPLEQGVAPLVWAATDASVTSGLAYDAKQRPLKLNKASSDRELARTAWVESERVLQLAQWP